MNNWLFSIWTTRALMTFAVAVNLHTVVTIDGAWRVLGVVMITLMLAVWALAEATRRRSQRRRWDIAADTVDPVGFLAQAEYMSRLSLREHKAVLDWVVDHGFAWTDDDVDDAPPVVRGWIEAGTRPPRENR